MLSHSLDSCMPAPTCSNDDFKFTSLSGIQENTKYLGDASKANWVAEGNVVPYGDSILLTMPPDSSGTLLSSTNYVWYGKISATMKTSRGAGVVTAFIMMSDVKDEIDYEFIGTDVQHAQSNYYWQGTLNYTNEVNISSSSTDSEQHTYTIDWQENSITWSVDGNVGRTVKKDETFNSSTNSYQYPQTPARVQLSLWPAGNPKNGQGTVNWAGGEIDWSSPYMTNGYYKAEVMEVSVECYDPPTGVKSSGSKSYVYNNVAGLEQNVAIGNDNTVLSSFYATGEHPNLDPGSSNDNKPSSTGSSSGAVNTKVATVPGVSGGGARGGDGSTSSGSSTGGSSSSGSDSGSIGGGSNGGFIQGTSSTGSTSGAADGRGERMKQGSALAGLIALVLLVAF